MRIIPDGGQKPLKGSGETTDHGTPDLSHYREEQKTLTKLVEAHRMLSEIYN